MKSRTNQETKLLQLTVILSDLDIRYILLAPFSLARLLGGQTFSRRRYRKSFPEKNTVNCCHTTTRAIIHTVRLIPDALFKSPFLQIFQCVDIRMDILYPCHCITFFTLKDTFYLLDNEDIATGCYFRLQHLAYTKTFIYNNKKGEQTREALTPKHRAQP